jgi:hypothetical protein
MKLPVAIVLAIFSWIVFATLNELTSANNDCCKTNTCGQSIFTKVLYFSDLFVAIILTLGVLFEVYDKSTDSMTLPFGIPMIDILGAF